MQYLTENMYINFCISKKRANLLVHVASRMDEINNEEELQPQNEPADNLPEPAVDEDAQPLPDNPVLPPVVQGIG